MKRTRLATPIRKALDFKAKRPRTEATTTPPNATEKPKEGPSAPIVDQSASTPVAGQTMAESATAARTTMIPGFTFDPAFVTNNTNSLDPTKPTFDPAADYYTCDAAKQIILAVYPDGSCAITPNKADANFVVFQSLDEALNDAYNYLSLIPEATKAKYRKMWGIKADVRDESLPPGINRTVGESDRTKAIDIPGFTQVIDDRTLPIGSGMIWVDTGNSWYSYDANPMITLTVTRSGNFGVGYPGSNDIQSFGSLDEALTDINNHEFAGKVAPHRLTPLQTTHNNNLHYPLVKSMFDE